MTRQLSTVNEPYLLMSMTLSDDDAGRVKHVPEAAGVTSMEALDSHRGITAGGVEEVVRNAGGVLWGLWNGGTFGLDSNSVLLISTLPASDASYPETLGKALYERYGLMPESRSRLLSTVRPTSTRKPDTWDGITVLRWIRLPAENVPAYLELSEPSWSYFERKYDAVVYGLFLDADCTGRMTRLLIVTKYTDFSEWERSRTVGADDGPLWAKRAALETGHFGIAARPIP